MSSAISTRRSSPRRLVVAAAAVAASVAVAACGTSTIEAADLESQLAQQLAPQAELTPADVAVNCPEDQETQQGAQFNCMLVAPNGEEVQVDVTLTNEEGGFEAVVPPEQFE